MDRTEAVSVLRGIRRWARHRDDYATPAAREFVRALATLEDWTLSDDVHAAPCTVTDVEVPAMLTALVSTLTPHTSRAGVGVVCSALIAARAALASMDAPDEEPEAAERSGR